MDLYYSPLACSLASRIAIYEAALEGETKFHKVALWTKRYDDDADYWSVTGMGQVPALTTRDGSLLTENAAVLQYIADLAPASGLAPAPTSRARYELQQWLSYIGTELHKFVFHPVFNPHVPPEMKAFARERAMPKRLDFVEAALADGRAYLVGDTFTVADAYLLTVLNWASTLVDLAKWPAIAAYHKRMIARPHVKRAFVEERSQWDGKA